MFSWRKGKKKIICTEQQVSEKKKPWSFSYEQWKQADYKLSVEK